MLRLASLKVSRQRLDASLLVGHVSLKVVVTLATLAMRDHREASTVLRRCARVHHSLGAQAALHPEVLGLAPDQSDHIAAQKHLHLSVAILEELVLGHLALVAE